MHHAGVATAIEAMAAAAWEIRNSASLAFTALLMRTVGFKNLAKVTILPALQYPVPLMAAGMQVPTRQTIFSLHAGAASWLAAESCTHDTPTAGLIFSEYQGCTLHCSCSPVVAKSLGAPELTSTSVRDILLPCRGRCQRGL